MGENQGGGLMMSRIDTRQGLGRIWYDAPMDSEGIGTLVRLMVLGRIARISAGAAWTRMSPTESIALKFLVDEIVCGFEVWTSSRTKLFYSITDR